MVPDGKGGFVTQTYIAPHWGKVTAVSKNAAFIYDFKGPSGTVLMADYQPGPNGTVIVPAGSSRTSFTSTS